MASRNILPLVVVGEPPTFVTPRDDTERAIARDAFAVQWAYVHGRATPDELFKFFGKRVDGRAIEINPDALDEWARRGEFDLAEIYRELFS